jgi:hypothetical protein
MSSINRTPFDRRTIALRYEGLSQKEAVEKTSAEYLEMRRKAQVHDELVTKLTNLLARADTMSEAGAGWFMEQHEARKLLEKVKKL